MSQYAPWSDYQEIEYTFQYVMEIALLRMINFHILTSAISKQIVIQKYKFIVQSHDCM